MNLYQLIRPLIFKLEPETAHEFAIKFLRYFPNLLSITVDNRKFYNLKQTACGLDFASPVGMAAGFDKNAYVNYSLQKFGFGFIETGTVTPKAQSGNPRPRLFRLEEDQAIINRLGFNNEGADIFLKNILSTKLDIPRGINIGKNKDTVDAASDYVFLLEKFYAHASYITINISSPNTKDLRDLQQGDQLDSLLSTIIDKKNSLKKLHNKNTPIWLKLAPDLTWSEQEKIAEIVLKHKIDALIISNTTISREFNLKSKYATETGGLSGQPLFKKSNEVLKNFYKLTDKKIPLIGVGGIACAQDAYTKIKCGATLVQLYSALIYQGFGMVEEITRELSDLVKRDGYENISQAIGQDT